MNIEICNISTSIGLSCEKYTNQGGTYEMYKEVIESITDPFSWCGMLKLRCDRSGINGNPTVTFNGPTPSRSEIQYLVAKIENGICSRLGLKLRVSEQLFNH